jgi:hypothetical protein
VQVFVVSPSEYRCKERSAEHLLRRYATPQKVGGVLQDALLRACRYRFGQIG